MDETFKTNLANGARVSASSVRMGHKKFAAENIVDVDKNSYWATDENIRNATLTILLSGEKEFDRIMLQEPVRFGQRISSFAIEVNQNGVWKEIVQATTIGFKRLLRVNPVKTDKVRIVIKNANNTPALSNFGLYKASSKEEFVVD